MLTDDERINRRTEVNAQDQQARQGEAWIEGGEWNIAVGELEAVLCHTVEIPGSIRIVTAAEAVALLAEK